MLKTMRGRVGLIREVVARGIPSFVPNFHGFLEGFSAGDRPR